MPWQTASLERRTFPTGREEIRKGPGCRDDLCNSAAGAGHKDHDHENRNAITKRRARLRSWWGGSASFVRRRRHRSARRRAAHAMGAPAAVRRRQRQVGMSPSSSPARTRWERTIPKHGLQLGYDQVDTPPSQERDDICDSLARLLGFLKTSLRNDAYKQAAHGCPLYPQKQTFFEALGLFAKCSQGDIPLFTRIKNRRFSSLFR